MAIPRQWTTITPGGTPQLTDNLVGLRGTANTRLILSDIKNVIINSITPAYTFYFSTLTGDDATGNGSIVAPFKTYNAAVVQAQTVATSATPAAVFSMGRSKIIGNMIVYPFIYPIGYNSTISSLECTGQLLLDSSFDTVVSPIFFANNIAITADGGINMQFTVTQFAIIIFFNAPIVNTPTVNAVGSGGITNEIFAMVSCFTLSTQPTFTFKNIIPIFQDAFINPMSISLENDSLINYSLLVMLNNIALDAGGHNISIKGSLPSPGAIFYTQNSSINSLTMDGDAVVALTDVTSYPSNLTFINGSSMSNILIFTSSDGLSANDNFSPTNYLLPFTVDYPTTSVTNNLAGIDIKLGELAAVPALLIPNNLSDVPDNYLARENIEVPTSISGSGSPNVNLVLGRAGDLYRDTDTVPDTLYICTATGTSNWEIPGTTAIEVTAPSYGEMFFQGNSSATTIVTMGVPVKINATYVSGQLQGFTHSGGTLTCMETTPRVYDIKVATTASLTLATANITVFIAKNGAVIAQSAQSPDCDGVSPSFKSISVNKLVLLGLTDTIEVWVQNNSSTDSITHQDLNVIVGSPGAAGSVEFDNNLLAQIVTGVVANTTSSVPLNNTNVGSMLIPANTLKVGDSFQVKLAGLKSRALSGGPGDLLNLSVASTGGIILAETTNMTISGNQTQSGYAFECILTVRAIGAAGVAIIQSSMSTVNLASSAQAIVFNNSTTFDTTIDLDLKLYAQWNIASGLNYIDSQILILTKI